MEKIETKLLNIMLPEELMERLRIGVKNDKTEKRYTYLRQRLRERRLAIFSEERRINVYQTDRI